MSLHIASADNQMGSPDRPENALRTIGEILPLVIAKYGINSIDHHHELSRNAARCRPMMSELGGR